MVKRTSQNPFEMLEQFIGDLMLQMKIPGMSIGVLVNGKSVYNEGFGARNLEKNFPMTPDTLFGIGSISKSFAALAIMQLCEQNKLDPQDSINKYVNCKLSKKENPIKIHHLLTHTTGFPELWALHSLGFRLAGGFDEIPPMTSWKDFWTFVNGATSEKVAEPGQVHYYNNDTFAIVGQIVEKVSKKSYHDYIRDTILLPLKMNRSTYLKESFESDANAITGYLTLDGKLVSSQVPFNELDYADGGLMSSVKELQNYMIALMSDGNFGGKQIVQKSSLDKMWTPYAKAEGGMFNIKNGGYGYGWEIDKDFFGHTLVSHGGDFLVCGGEIAMVPEKKMGVVIGMNKEPGPIAEMIARGILAVLLGKDMNEAVPMLKLLNTFQLLTGKYVSYKGILKAEVLMQGGMLTVSVTLPKALGGTMTLPLLPKNIDELLFAVPMLGTEMPVKVIQMEPESKKVSIMVDRYLLHKI